MMWMVTFEPRTMRRLMEKCYTESKFKCKGPQASKGSLLVETKRRPVCLESKRAGEERKESET